MEKKILYAGWFGNTIPTPQYVKDNLAFLESQPFDGLIVYLRDPAMTFNVTAGAVKPALMTYDQIAGVLAPIKGLPLKHLDVNFALIQMSTPPDFFDSWEVALQNFENLGRAIKDAGLRGIVIDNEQYSSKWGNYPDGAKYKDKSLREYKDFARFRGEEIMAALQAGFGGVEVMSLHGPYVSDSAAPPALGFPQWQTANELLGPFHEGLINGSAGGVVHDGGELYTLRTADEFIANAGYRRAHWAGGISFGVYDKAFGGKAMDSTILQTTLRNALEAADKYVWLYAEGRTYLKPAEAGGATWDWVHAVREARD